MKVIAFDIDGALTDEGGVETYRSFSERGQFITGIVTSRTKSRMNDFIEKNNLETDFEVSAHLKGQALTAIANDHPEADEYMYYGSWIRDRLHSRIAGWQYKQL